MSFSLNKQDGVAIFMPILWISVGIGLVSFTALKSNENPAIEVSGNSGTYELAELKNAKPQEITGLPITEIE